MREPRAQTVMAPSAASMHSVRVPGFLSSSSSNVDVSAGGDSDLMSFYSTTAATTWKAHAPRVQSPAQSGDTVTGFIKNFGNIQPVPDDAPLEKYTTTYSHVNSEREQLQRSKNAAVNPLTNTAQQTGGFISASCPSPIKYSALGRPAFPSKRLLDQRRKRDPTEWEHQGAGPADYETTFGSSWTHPSLMEDKCHARASLGGSNSAVLERACLTSGWRENTILRDHPWVHPGVPPDVETTYRVTNRIPSKNAVRSEMQPMSSTAFSRSQRKIVLGRGALMPEDRMSTTHSAYLAGRTSPYLAMAPGSIVELNSNVSQQGLSNTGFSKNVSQPQNVFPRAPDTDLPTQSFYDTTTSTAYEHPSRWASTRAGTTMVDGAAGLPSAFGRAVVPVTRLQAVGAPTLGQLHPSIAALRARRDPLYYDSKTYKITMDAKPWGVPAKMHLSAPFN